MNIPRAELLILMAKDGATDEEAWATLLLARYLLIERSRMQPPDGMVSVIREKARAIVAAEKEAEDG